MFSQSISTLQHLVGVVPNPKTLSDGSANSAHVSSYILWDSHRMAPPGFGVRVAGKKTYVLRRKVDGRSIMPTVGNVADGVTFTNVFHRGQVLFGKRRAYQRKVAVADFSGVGFEVSVHG